MRLTYGELPRLETCNKLEMVSFDTPQKNVSVFNFVDSLKKHIMFFENERNKLIMKYGKKNDDSTYTVIAGNEQCFLEDVNAVLSVEIDEDIPSIGITENDLRNAVYAPEKHLWLSPAEIGFILKFCDK